jgi:spore coat polysaccharide biosynthesis protein SpsF
MHTVIILQARMGSTRLPGKVMLPLEGKTVLEHVLRRLLSVHSSTQLVIATTINAIDDQIVDLARSLGIDYFRGSEDDVLSRYYWAAKEFGAQLVVRCNSDCPLIDPGVVDLIISTFHANSGRYDYVSNILNPTFPTGMHCEAFTFEALQMAFLNAKDSQEREHVTPYIYRNPNLFDLHNVELSRNLSYCRWTLDFPEDYVLISKIYQSLYKINPLFGTNEVIELIEKNPEWSEINGHIIKQATI